MPTDLELLERWRSGERTAGNQLVARYFPKLRLYFRSRVQGDHEDLVQETFSKLLGNLDRIEIQASFRAYLYGVASKVLAASYRKRYKVEFNPITDSIADLSGERQSSILAARERNRLLLDSLRALPLQEQDLLEHYYFERLSARELGLYFKATEGAIRSRLRLALIRLRKTYFKLAALPHERELSEDELELWLRTLHAELLAEQRKPPEDQPKSTP